MTVFAPISAPASDLKSLLRRKPGGDELTWPLAGIALVLALQFTMIFTRAMNWDEFYHYSLVELFSRGTVTQPFQTFFVRLFFWLPGLPGNEIDHIVIARILMFACEIVAAVATGLLAARFTNRTAGALAALCYLSAGFVLQYGFSFRADPVAAALLMSMLAILGCSDLRGWRVFVFAALGALAELYTIKCVLYAPAFAGLAYLRLDTAADKRAFAIRLVAAGVIAAALFAGLLYLHSLGVSHPADSAGALLENSAQRMPALGGSPLYRQFMLEAALTAPVFVLLILAFPFAVRSASISSAEKWALTALWSEILVLGVYQNTAQYFYAFILPPVAVAAALPLSRLPARLSPKVVVTAFTTFAFVIWAAEDRTTIAKQRTLVEAADAIFPNRIAYFDFCGMLAHLDKANAFMTPWGGATYRAGGFPSMVETMRNEAVPLVLADDPMFRQVLQGRQPSRDFLPDDAAAIRATYLHLWGPFWIAGKIVPADVRDLAAKILVPGPYTVSGADLEVDGHLVRSGEIVELNRGSHRFSAVSPRSGRLTWGKHLRTPAEQPPPEPYWIPF